MNEPSALISASAMHLLLAQNPDFDDLPVEWTIDLDRVIRPFITVRHPDGDRATRLIAAALEIDIRTSEFSDNGIPTRSLHVEGRWGGASWNFTTYVSTEAGDPA